MYATYGQYGAYGQYGSGGGVLLPASTSDILQWLKGVDSDGITILDKKNEEFVSQPEVRDVNCLDFDGTVSTTLEFGDIVPDGSTTIKFECG